MRRTPRRTPRKRLKFDVVEETPAVAARSSKTCVLIEKSSRKWVPALVEARAKGLTEAVLADGTHTKVDFKECRVMQLDPNEEVRILNDMHSYAVVRSFHSGANSKFVLENGDDSVELVSRRGDRALKTLLKDLFLYDGSKKPRMSDIREKPVNGSPTRGAQRDISIIYHLPAGPASGKIFSDCAFVLVDDLLGDLETELTANGAQVLRLASDLLDTSRMHLLLYDGPQLEFFALIGHSIAPTRPYLEALALGWPCLSPEFVRESIFQQQRAPWHNYLLASVSPDGFVKSQNCSDFRELWSQSATLERQFECRPYILGPITVPIYVHNTMPDDILLLVALTCPKFRVLCGDDKKSIGGILISHTESKSTGYNENVRLSMCRQPRLARDEHVVLPVQWLVQCILAQKIV